MESKDTQKTNKENICFNEYITSDIDNCNYEKPKLKRSVEYYEYPCYDNSSNFDVDCEINELLTKYEKIMILKIYIDDEDIIKKYDEYILENNKRLHDNKYIDAGFDIFNPYDLCCNDKIIKYNLKIKCSASIKTDRYKFYNTGFYLYPRSSIVKTPLRLSNSVGIIDSGYRNNLMAVYDNLGDNEFKIEKYSRLVQICSPSLAPIYVIRVSEENELSEKTERNMGGFGSTGL